MIGEIISNYMLDSRRLVVPGVGAFIRKDDGPVLFTELLRADDGILLSLIQGARGCSQAEATAMLEAFITDLKQGAALEGGVLIDRVGVMTLDEKGQFKLDSSRAAQDAYMQRIGQGKQGPAKPGKAGTGKAKQEPDYRNQNGIFVQTDKYKKSKDPKKNVIRYGRGGGMKLVITIAVIAIVVALAVIVYSAMNDPMLGF